jgi:PPK2 family polyphosphate:nucleotide phosphotransferase
MAKQKLSKISTCPPESLASQKKKIKAETQVMIEKIKELQYKMYAEGKRSILIVLQGLDGSGKDGVVRHIFSGMNPSGVKVASFKQPTPLEASHDFLRRIHQNTPAKGEVQVFNRSHYEDILVPSVEKLFDKKVIDARYTHINDFEKTLKDSGTTIIKCYLHISPGVQKQRFDERLANPQKHWKFRLSDRSVRAKFAKYQSVYEEVFERCDEIEWNIIPSDQNRYKIYCISKLILDAFKNMNLKRPDLPHDAATKAIKRQEAKAIEERKDDQKEETEEGRAELAKKKKEERKKKIDEEKKAAKKVAKKAAKAKKKAKKEKKEVVKEKAKAAKKAQKEKAYAAKKTAKTKAQAEKKAWKALPKAEKKAIKVKEKAAKQKKKATKKATKAPVKKAPVKKVLPARPVAKKALAKKVIAKKVVAKKPVIKTIPASKPVTKAVIAPLKLIIPTKK